MVFAGVLGCARPASAQNGVDLGGFVGGLLVPSGSDLDPGNALAVGARAGYNFSHCVAVEAELDFSQGNTRDGSRDFALFGFLLQGVHEVWRSESMRLGAFVSGGVGMRALANTEFMRESESVRFDFDDPEYHFALGLGAGVTRDLSPSVGLRLDARYYGLFNFPDEVGHDQPGFESEMPLSSFAALAGVFVRLGAPAEPP